MEKMRREYTIRSISGEPDWKEIPVIRMDQVLWQPDCGIRAAGQICCDSEFLHVHLCAAETEIRAENTAPLSPVCEDSCLEFFFMPEKEDRYFNFEINPNGCLYIGFGRSLIDRAALYRSDMNRLFHIRTQRTADGWEAFYSIPLSFLRVFVPDFSFAGNLLGNLYKCGDKTANRHYLSWSPVSSERPNFHRTEDFGIMRF